MPKFSDTPNSTGPPEEAVERIIRAYERFHAWIVKVHVPHFLELNLTLAQLRTLYLVAAAGPMRMSQVAERLGTAPSTSTGVVDGLVTMGLLERHEDPSDRRQVLVRTTHAARERLEDFHALGLVRLRALLEHVEDDDALGEIERAINLLTDAARRLNEDPAP